MNLPERVRDSNGSAMTSVRADLSRLRAGCLPLCLLLFAAGARAEPAGSLHPETGRLEVQSFGAEDYGAHTQNWAVAQTPRGLIYVGNTNGVLEYDGVSWRLIEMPNRSAVRSACIWPPAVRHLRKLGWSSLWCRTGRTPTSS